jgi:hypothetical protein
MNCRKSIKSQFVCFFPLRARQHVHIIKYNTNHFSLFTNLLHFETKTERHISGCAHNVARTLKMFYICWLASGRHSSGRTARTHHFWPSAVALRKARSSSHSKTTKSGASHARGDEKRNRGNPKTNCIFKLFFSDFIRDEFPACPKLSTVWRWPP